ncbi:PQQ-dependent sugar dehydrogenase [Cellulosimicrobium sp. E-16]|uniref:PQQ-dependent sugar dehydrogenase n=1 Tax=Cellulosimicrobium sp. E-16 TaxID=3404049 RepID=UPI003CE88B8F
MLVPLTVGGAYAHPGHEEGGDTAAADAAALDWDNYEKVLLSKDTGEPIDLAVLPDSRVLHTARDGVVRLTDPTTGLTSQIAQLDVYKNSEDGLQGISLDPDFEENHFVYLVYAPRVMEGTSPSGVDYPETTPSGSAPNSLPAGEDESYWDRWLGYNVLSRFTWDPATATIDLSTEREILKVDAQRGQCCHVGADMAWDEDGNLFLSTGDNTPASAPGAAGYAPNNNAPGMNPGFDDRRGAGSTNDLRGKILRINPIEDLAAGTEVGPGSTYTIPEGNLFDDPQYDDVRDLVRDETYVMGLRNPFRIDYDAQSGALVWGDYGPDAATANPDRGPMGYVEWNLTTEPMNGGWPYCHGPNANYNEYDYATSTPGDFFDCEAGAENNSTWNTGLDVLPPATAPQVYYGDNPGDQPELLDPLTAWGGGGQAPMGGPIFRSADYPDAPGKFPAYWDGKPFMAEFSQDYVAAFTLDELSSAGVVTAVEDFLPNAHLTSAAQPIWDNVMDFEFGPDGNLYVLEYGDGFFRQNPDAGLYRVSYSEGNQHPQASFTASAISSSEAPLEVTFDASRSSDPEGAELTYEWDFDGDGQTDATGVKVTHEFTELGQYDVILRVTDPEGLFTLSTKQITVGNTAPEISVDVADGAIFNWGDKLELGVSVHDAEDGDEVTCTDVKFTFGLGHNTHAHPEVTGTAAATADGCGITIQTNADAVEHGEGEKIFGTLVVTYTDQAQGDVPATTGELTRIFKPEEQQAEWYDEAEGIEVVVDETADAGGYVTSLDAGDSFAYEPVAFEHAPSGEAINRVTVLGRGEGTVTLGWEGADGTTDESLAELRFASEGWTDVTRTLTSVPEGSGKVVVTSTGGVDVDNVFFGKSVIIPADQVSLQMFSLIPWVTADGQPAVLDRLGEIGLKNIEPFGGNYSGLTAEQFRAQADDAGLSVPSSHYNVGEANFDDTLDYVATVGQKYVGSGGFPSPGIGSLENTLATAETMNRLGQRSVEAGVGKVFGHNHDQEFTTRYEYDGELTSAWEILVAETNPEFVTFELDTAWAAHAGVDVPALIEQYGDRIELLHIKDAVNLNAGGRPTFTNLGDGDMPLQEILAAGQEAGVAYYVMEYDMAADGESFATTGFEYLTGEAAGGSEEPTEPVTIPVDKVSMQLFSLSSWSRQIGWEGVYDRLGEIGFENVEPFGSNYSGLTAEQARAQFDAAGLRVPSSHYNVNEGTFDATLAYVKTMGQEYVGSGGFPSPGIGGGLENVLATAEAMDRLGARSVANGTGKLFGHNHDQEFTTKYEYNGALTSAWEILVAETDPELVAFELDTAWAANAGVDVPALIEEHADRIELLHIKDATNLNAGGRPTFTKLGEGDMPLQEILRAGLDADVAYFVMEYDGSPANDEFSAEGFEYLTGIPAGADTPEVDVTVEPRCLAGKTYVAVRALNADDSTLDVAIETPFGSKTFADVAPGKNAYQSFSTRATEIEAGEVTVTVTDADGGTDTVTAGYAARSCG